MSILIVEDNPVNARLLALMLNAQGYQTVVAKNGIEALATAAETPDIQLIITDYMMPEMDGLEFIVKVRALPAFNNIPIIVASAHADLETVKMVQGLQCDGFLVKPIDKKQLIKRVEHLLRSQPLVLLGKNTTMDRLGIGPAEYNELINAFAPNWAQLCRWWCWNKQIRKSPFPRIWAGYSRNLRKVRPCLVPINSYCCIRSAWDAACWPDHNALHG